MTKRLMLVFAFILPLLVAPPAHAQTPNRLDVVQRVAANKGKASLQACRSTDHDPNCGQFTRLVACALQADGFGLLTKAPGENQVDGYAVDAIISKSNQVIDLISGGLQLQWVEVAKRAGNDYHAPIGCDGPTFPPPPPPPPATDAQLEQLKQQTFWLEKIAGRQAETNAQLKALRTDLQKAIADLKSALLNALPLLLGIRK